MLLEDMRPLLIAALLLSTSGFAQSILDGEWTPLRHEDEQERGPGPDLGDYLGLPINDAARLRADSWNASRLTLQEHQCRVHISPYIYRGPNHLRIWTEKDPQTQRIIAIKNYISTYEQTRTIWMDGRPHPSPYAAHTFMGFSTGVWEGDTLTVKTTHIKQGWIRRNGLAESDQATVIEHFLRHGNLLTHVSIVMDPVYMTEPLVKSEDFTLDQVERGGWLWPCEYVEEITGRPKDEVPNHLPGANPFLKEFPQRWGLPEAAARGGAQTMYPEYRAKMTPPREAPVYEPKSRPTESTQIEVLPVQGNVYMIAGAGGNIAVQIGKNGVLLVDSGDASMNDKAVIAIRKLSDQPLRYILNTGVDSDHTGGNERFADSAGASPVASVINTPGESAAQGVQILAHDNLLNRMNGSKAKPAAPFNAWPTDTFLAGPKELFFNGESVIMSYQPAAHTDGDSIVYFRRSDVVSTGDIFITTGYPVIDLQKGGTIQGVIDGLNHILDLAVPEHHEEGGTYIIPGHGRICDEFDVVEYRDMVTIIRDRVQAMKRKGMTLEQVKAARPTLDYDPQYGARSGPWTTDLFVEAIYKTLH